MLDFMEVLLELSLRGNPQGLAWQSINNKIESLDSVELLESLKNSVNSHCDSVVFLKN